MATKKESKTAAELAAETKRALEAETVVDHDRELVRFTYPLDMNNPEAVKYACINGENIVIKTGVEVEIPRCFAKQFEQQMAADIKTARKAAYMAAHPTVLDNG